jgi:hypothetical protein
MFPIDPDAPGGPDRSESVRRSYLDHNPVGGRLPTLPFSQGRPPRLSMSLLSGRPTAAARQAGTIPSAEAVPRAAGNGIARSPRADRSPSGSHGAVEA